MFKKNFLVMVFIDFMFVLSSFFTFFFASKIIQNKILLVYSMQDELQKVSQLLNEETNRAVLGQITSIMEIINSASNYIIFTAIVALIFFFLLWCFFKGLVWRHSCYSKKELFDGFGKYFLKFTAASLAMFLLMVPLSLVFVNELSSLILEGFYRFEVWLLLFFLMALIVVLFLAYLFSVVFVYLNEYGLIEGLKKGIVKGVKKPLAFLSFLGIWILMFVLLFIDRILSDFFIAFMVIDLVIILLVLAFYRFWFCEYVK